MVDRTLTGEQIIVPDTDPDWDESGLWDDLRFPMTGAGIDTSTGRLGTDYVEACVFFATNARYTEEPAIMNVQLSHGWKEGSSIHLHLHWYQDENNMPNWMIRARVSAKGAAPGAWANTAWASNAYTHPGGAVRIHQITEFPPANLSSNTVSDMIQVILYRDSANASGLFGGADPYTVDALTLEFDGHIIFENLGSPNEYFK